MILRQYYIDFIRPYFNTPFVKILMAVRRCGKSKILEMIKNEILSTDIKEEKTYVFIDEVQEADGWGKAINSLMVDYDVDIYVIGSNSKLLSVHNCGHKTVEHIFLGA